MVEADYALYTNQIEVLVIVVTPLCEHCISSLDTQWKFNCIHSQWKRKNVISEKFMLGWVVEKEAMRYLVESEQEEHKIFILNIYNPSVSVNGFEFYGLSFQFAIFSLYCVLRTDIWCW